MACTVGNKCAKNLCKQTVLLQLIVENVVTCFFWNTVYILQATTIVPATAAADNKSNFSILITIFLVFYNKHAVNKYVIVRHAQRPAHCAVIGYDTVRRCKKIDMSIPWSQSNRSRILVVNNALLRISATQLQLTSLNVLQVFLP